MTELAGAGGGGGGVFGGYGVGDSETGESVKVSCLKSLKQES